VFPSIYQHDNGTVGSNAEQLLPWHGLEVNSCKHSVISGLPVQVQISPHYKIQHIPKCYTGPQTWADSHEPDNELYPIRGKEFLSFSRTCCTELIVNTGKDLKVTIAYLMYNVAVTTSTREKLSSETDF
jgi:hypothetical protein